MNSNVLNSVLKQVSRELCVDLKTVEVIYKSYWRFIRDCCASCNLVEITKEEYESTDMNFNIPYIGKLYVDYDKVQKRKNHLKYVRDNVKTKKD